MAVTAEGWGQHMKDSDSLFKCDAYITSKLSGIQECSGTRWSPEFAFFFATTLAPQRLGQNRKFFYRWIAWCWKYNACYFFSRDLKSWVQWRVIIWLSQGLATYTPARELEMHCLVPHFGTAESQFLYHILDGLSRLVVFLILHVVLLRK